MAAKDVYITLRDDKETDNNIEIVIGGWTNTKSVIRATHQPETAVVELEGPQVDINECKTFWVTWADNGDIKVGTGTVVGQNEIMAGNIVQDINYVGFTTAYGGVGHWNFGKLLYKSLSNYIFSTIEMLFNML